MQNGKKVRVEYSVPISFALATDDVKDNKMGYVPETSPAKNLLDTSSTYHATYVKNGNSAKPLYVLDGKIIKQEQMQLINPKSIESITVLKDNNATALYGKEGENGVIMIKSKKAAK